MRDVLFHSETRLDEFRTRPLFAFLAERSTPPADRLAFCRHMAHFIMSFSDLCTLMLRQTPTTDRLQEIVNAHADEDSQHWQYYLADLEALGHDHRLTFSEALRFVWGRETERTRLLTYRLCRLGYGASPLQKLVLITAVEATAGFGLAQTAAVARELAEGGGPELAYFGARHIQEERDHELQAADVRDTLLAVRLDDETRGGLCRVVDEVFDAFTELVDELDRARRYPKMRRIMRAQR